MKWISPRPGFYKYVSDDHPDPECAPANKPGIPYIKTSLPWAESEPHILSSDNTTSIKATDHFLAEREKWTATSERYRKYEADRKKEWAKNKPAWRKKRAQNGGL